MIDVVLLFGVGFVVTVLHGFLVRWVASFLVEDRAAYVAGFSFALGMSYVALGQISGPFLDMKIGALSGVVAGLALIWHRFFGRRRADG